MHFLLHQSFAFQIVCFLSDPGLSEKLIVVMHSGHLHVKFVESMRIEIWLVCETIACEHIGNSKKNDIVKWDFFNISIFHIVLVNGVLWKNYFKYISKTPTLKYFLFEINFFNAFSYEGSRQKENSPSCSVSFRLEIDAYCSR